MNLCFYTTDLYNTKTKSKLTKNKTEPYLIFGDQMGNGKIKKNRKEIYKYFHKFVYNPYCLQSFLVEIKHLKYLRSYMCVAMINSIRCVRSQE